MKYIYKFSSIIFSTFLIIYLYKNFNLENFQTLLINSDAPILFISFSISLFLGVISGYRFYFFSKLFGFNKFPSFSTSTRSYFITSLLNLFLPSKIGDLSKGYISSLLDKSNYDLKIHLYTIYEKISDLFAILFIAVFTDLILNLGLKSYFEDKNLKILLINNHNLSLIYITIFAFLLLILLPSFNPKVSLKIKDKFKSIFHKDILNKVIKIKNFKSCLNNFDFLIYEFFSVFIWLIHIFQICLFAQAIYIDLWSFSGIFLIITTILFGLLPISFAGIGTRDALLVYLLSPDFGNTKALFLGLLMTTRYLIPAIVGLIFLKDINFKIPKKGINYH